MLRHSAVLLSVAAAAALAAESDATAVAQLPPQCAAPMTGRCPTPIPRSSYANSAGLLTAAECCAQCVADGSLCFGWTWSGPGPDTETSKPGGGSCNQFDAPLSTTNRQPHNCTFGVNARDPPKPLPASPKKPPPGAKNVLFLVADGACCPNFPLARLPRSRAEVGLQYKLNSQRRTRPDMRPSINPFAIEGEAPRYTTPALDELARTGTLFTRAYIQISYCAPSRNSFMSGRRPDSTNIYSFIGTFRDPSSGQHWVSLPEQFVQNGYNVGGSGKLFHVRTTVGACWLSRHRPAVPLLLLVKRERLLSCACDEVHAARCASKLRSAMVMDGAIPGAW